MLYSFWDQLSFLVGLHHPVAFLQHVEPCLVANSTPLLNTLSPTSSTVFSNAFCFELYFHYWLMYNISWVLLICSWCYSILMCFVQTYLVNEQEALHYTSYDILAALHLVVRTSTNWFWNKYKGNIKLIASQSYQLWHTRTTSIWYIYLTWFYGHCTCTKFCLCTTFNSS